MASGAFEAQSDKMFGTPDQSRLYGSWQLAEGIREGLGQPPGWAGTPFKKAIIRGATPVRCRPGGIFTRR